MASTGPPAYAWDWLARQRLVWRECRRLLSTAAPGTAPAAPAAPAARGGRSRDFPDWSGDHPDLVPPSASEAPEPGPALRDYRALDTRAGVIAALREDYPADPRVRVAVDTVVGEVAFLGRLDVSLTDLGVRSAPRGMRWWWTHLTGRPAPATPSGPASASEPTASVPLQLRLVDVLAGYGDATEP